MNKFIYITILALAISGCAHKPVSSFKKGQATPSVRVQELATWEAQGRIAASRAGEGGSASFIWQQEPNFYKIRMYGPFGAGSAELTGSNKQVIFEENDGKRRFAQTPEELVFHATGLTIPVRGLKSWIQGIPSEAYKIEKIIRDATGQIKHLQQSGWHIEYVNYMQIKGQWMPSRINLMRDQIKIKLIVKKWQV